MTARACHWIRTRRARLPPAGIVLFTAYIDDALNEQCVRAGADAVVVRSGEIDELTGARRRALRAGGASAGG